MDIPRLSCVTCGESSSSVWNSYCQECGGILRVEITTDADRLPQDRVDRLGELRGLIPIPDQFISLGEGNTPLLPLKNLEKKQKLFAKAEYQNPTGSFKDRGAALGISWASALKVPGVVVASTGNNAASVTAYASRAGIPSVVLVPENVAEGKLAQILAHGSLIIRVEGSFSDCHRIAEELPSRLRGWANLTSTYSSPLSASAYRSIAYEIVLQLGQMPGTVIVPIGTGPMLTALIEAFEFIADKRKDSTIPIAIGVQAAGCSPIATAYSSGFHEVKAWDQEVRTIASSIADPLISYPSHGTYTLQLVKRYGGKVVSVTDEEILAAMSALAAQEGIFSEPTAAATLASLNRLGNLRDPVVLIISGHGLKDPGKWIRLGRSRKKYSAIVEPENVFEEIRLRLSQDNSLGEW